MSTRTASVASPAQPESSSQRPRRGSWLRPVLVIGFYFLIVGYPVIRLVGSLAPGWRPTSLELLAILVLPVAGWLAYQAHVNWFTRWCARVAYTWIGACFVLLCVTVPWELARFGLGIPAPAAGWIVLTVFLPLVGWALVNAQQLPIKTVRVSSPKLARDLDIVQLSDVHIGSRTPAWLRRVVTRTNALAPDAVFVTGDLVDMRELSTRELDPIADIDAPVFFCIGNHERYVECDQICAQLESLGVEVLRNRDVDALGIRIVGIDDIEDRAQMAMALQGIEISPDRFTVLLYHRPDGLEAAMRAGVDLMLCGHTHNGQIVPFNWMVRRVYPKTAGRFDENGTVLYVSSGTGTWGPTMRLGTTNEITVLELRQS